MTNRANAYLRSAGFRSAKTTNTNTSIAEGPQMVSGADVEFAVGDGGSGGDAGIEFVSRQHVEGVRGLNHGDVSARGGEVDFPVGGNRRGPVLAFGFKAFLLIESFPGLGPVTRDAPAVLHQMQAAPIEQRR